MSRIGLAAVAALVLLASCGGDASDDAVGRIPENVVFAEFPRYLQVEGTHLEIAVDNQSGEDLEFTTLGLDVPGFEVIAPEVDDRLVRAGRRVDLRVPFGAVECDESPTDPTVVGSIQSDGDEMDVEISIDPAPLEQVQRERCGAIAVLEVVEIGFGQDFRREGDTVITTLDATLAGDGDAVVEDMRGSVIFTVRPVEEGELPLGRLDGESPTMALPVEFLASRCDVHAVAESKKTFQIPVWISAVGFDTQFVTIEPIGDLRDELQDLIQTCLEDSVDG